MVSQKRPPVRKVWAESLLALNGKRRNGRKVGRGVHLLVPVKKERLIVRPARTLEPARGHFNRVRPGNGDGPKMRGYLVKKV